MILIMILMMLLMMFSIDDVLYDDVLYAVADDPNNYSGDVAGDPNDRRGAGGSLPQ